MIEVILCGIVDVLNYATCSECDCYVQIDIMVGGSCRESNR